MLDSVVLEAAIRHDKGLAYWTISSRCVALEALMAREAATKMNDAQATELRQVLDDLGRQMSDPEANLAVPGFAG